MKVCVLYTMRGTRASTLRSTANLLTQTSMTMEHQLGVMKPLQYWAELQMFLPRHRERKGNKLCRLVVVNWVSAKWSVPVETPPTKKTNRCCNILIRRVAGVCEQCFPDRLILSLSFSHILIKWQIISKMDYLVLRMERKVTEQDLLGWTRLVPFPWRQQVWGEMFLETQETNLKCFFFFLNPVSSVWSVTEHTHKRTTHSLDGTSYNKHIWGFAMENQILCDRINCLDEKCRNRTVWSDRTGGVASNNLRLRLLKHKSIIGRMVSYQSCVCLTLQLHVRLSTRQSLKWSS